MATDRMLIDYLPPFVQSFTEMKEIFKTEQLEFDGLNDELKNTLSNQFILESNENGIRRWENVLKISPKNTDTIDERKFRVLTKQTQETPYTMRKLKQMLDQLCGVDGYTIECDVKNYHISVKLALGNHNNYNEVESVLNKMIPANMTKHVELLYNSNIILSRFTHTELSAYKHDQLRNEVFN